MYANELRINWIIAYTEQSVGRYISPVGYRRIAPRSWYESIAMKLSCVFAEVDDDARNSHLLFTLNVYQYRVDHDNSGQDEGKLYAEDTDAACSHCFDVYSPNAPVWLHGHLAHAGTLRIIESLNMIMLLSRSITYTTLACIDFGKRSLGC